MELREVVVVDAVRTPIGRYGGALAAVRPDDLAAHALRALVDRQSVPGSRIDDVFWGAANQAGEDNRNVARMAVLLAGLPVEIGGATVNRLCGSGLQAIVSAAREIQVGAADVIIAGGSESMTRAPYVLPKSNLPFGRGNQTIYDSTLGWRMVNPRMEAMYPPISLGETAERVAAQHGVSRESQDQFALRSHRQAIEAQDACRFSREIAPVDVPVSKGEPVRVSLDEGPRRDTDLAKLSRLPPAFVPNGTVTAGNSSQLNDGAAAVLLASADAARTLGWTPLARFVDAATAGVDPSVMGIGPVPSTRKLLARTGLRPDQLDIVELNEAFAAQAIACIRSLELDEERVNPNGGAIALGHPLGASGARLVTTLVHSLDARSLRWGLATMCIGVGQGISALFERAAA
ncbi:MAG TPA: acetyl-CoA C-acyltransferase [Chloroflexota bacterium]|nr:acetyl-CoA C-acyltransferase [Chloroflexota bacterium]